MYFVRKNSDKTRCLLYKTVQPIADSKYLSKLEFIPKNGTFFKMFFFKSFLHFGTFLNRKDLVL